MQIHVTLIDKRTAQIISIIGETVQVMDSETFATIDVTMIYDEVKGNLENDRNVEYWDVMGMTKIMRIRN